MKIVGLDTETFPIAPGQLCPQLVCGQFGDEQGQEVLDHVVTVNRIRELLKAPNTTLTLHNGPYDLAVVCAEDPSLLPLVFDGYASGKIRDTMTRAQLYDIAKGTFSTNSRPKFYTAKTGERVKIAYNLAALVKRYLGWEMPKDEKIRLHYGDYFGIPVAQWPQEFVKYAKDDARGARDLFLHQCTLYNLDEGEDFPGEMPTEILQNEAAWALHLMAVWGLRTDKERTYALKAKLEKEIAKIKKRLIWAGVMRSDETKNLTRIRELIEEAFVKQGKKPPLTESGNSVATDKDALLDAGRPILSLLAKLSKLDKIKTTYIPVLLQGINIPINPRFKVLVESMRTSCEEPNFQNFPREGGVRECCVARRGWVFISCDFDTQEIRSWAEACLVLVGKSDIAEALKRDEDVHLALAAELMGISYEEAKRRYDDGDPEVIKMRQFCKIPGFGLPGGLGEDTFIEYAKNNGVIIDKPMARRTIQAWRKRWSEAPLYFKVISSIVGRTDDGTVTLPYSGFVRGGLGYTQACNTFFQSHTAWGSKKALVAVTKECYLGSSPLYGTRGISYVHDEIIAETPEPNRRAPHDAALRLEKVMREVMQTSLPNVPAKATVVMTRRMYKGAKPVYVDGLLVPSKPITVDGKVKWIADL